MFVPASCLHRHWRSPPTYESTTPPAGAFVPRDLALPKERFITRHIALGMMLAQVLHVGSVIGHAAAQAGGLHEALPALPHNVVDR
jgi:hypothetical protein